MTGPVPPSAPAGAFGGAQEPHPDDPVPRRSSKAAAVLTLGIVGVLLMFCGGGLVPGGFALLLVRPARAEIAASAGYLTGGRALRAGEALSWIAVAVSALVVVGVVVGMLVSAGEDAPQYGEDVN